MALVVIMILQMIKKQAILKLRLSGICCCVDTVNKKGGHQVETGEQREIVTRDKKSQHSQPIVNTGLDFTMIDVSDIL